MNVCLNIWRGGWEVLWYLGGCCWDAGKVVGAGKLMDAGEVMDAGNGARGQTNAPTSEAPIFLAKGNLHVAL